MLREGLPLEPRFTTERKLSVDQVRYLEGGCVPWEMNVQTINFHGEFSFTSAIKDLKFSRILFHGFKMLMIVLLHSGCAVLVRVVRRLSFT